MSGTPDRGQIEAFREELSRAKLVLIGTHLNPDGDALGSALAMSHYLWQLGIKNEVLNHNDVPASLAFLPGADKIRSEPSHEGHDLGIMLDLNNLERLGKPGDYFRNLNRIVLIDHHVPQENPGHVQIVDTAAPATAVLLMRLLERLNATITPEIATCLLTGIVTDTGSFRFRNTTSESLALSAKLLDLGADINQVSDEVFGRKPLGAVRLMGIMFDNMKLEVEDRLVYSTLPHSSYVQTATLDEETEGFVNEMLAINTVEIAALVRETKPNWIRVSLRSRGDVDVAAVARELGGGGHRNAAGISFEGGIDVALGQLLPRLRACLGSS